MPSMRKRRESVPPNQTLHHFFTSTSVLSSQSGSKSKPKPKANSSAQSSKLLVNQQETIIIDSDSDDEFEILEAISSKRRKLTPRTTYNPVSAGTKSEHSTIIKHTSFKENKGASTSLNIREKPISTPSEDSISFGRPFLLQTKSTFLEDDVRITSFGQPFLLQGDSKPASGTHNNQCVVSNKPSLTIKEKYIDIDTWENRFDSINPETCAEWAKLDDTAKHEDNAPILDDYYEDSWDPESNEQRTSGNKFTAPSISTVPPENESAFSVLMTSFKDNEVWKEATVPKYKNPHGQAKLSGGRRPAPFYKVLQGMPIAVDAFCYGAIPRITAYFLTHAHSDHYTSLSSKWKNGPLYCSYGTANLIIHMLSVDPKWVHPLPMDTPTLIPDTNGVTVTLIEANHCPGSCIFYFEGCQTVNAGDSTFKSPYVGSPKVFRYLHCGDFRASPQHILHPAVNGKAIDHVYLDTTYLDPKYTFPPQPLVISACADLTKRIANGESLKEKNSSVLSWMLGNSNSKGKDREFFSKPLVVIGTYSIGKERIAKAIAQALCTKIFCDARKAAILKCQQDYELHELLTSNPLEGGVHLIPLSSVSTDQLKLYLDRYKDKYDRIIGFRPTGWTYSPPVGINKSPSVSDILVAAKSSKFTFSDLQLSPRSTSTVQLYPVPYSEHSSFSELTCFAMSFSWAKMIATVNVNSEKSRGKMAGWIAKWEAERRKLDGGTLVPYRHPDYW